MKINQDGLPDFLKIDQTENHPTLGTFEKEVGFAHTDWTAKHMDFWIKVYSLWSVRQGVIHDSMSADRIYEVLDFGTMDRRERRQLVQTRRGHWKQVLLNVHTKQNAPETMDRDERHVFDMFGGTREPSKFLAAARRKRIRFQLGQKERFKEALVESGKYLERMEVIFESEGVPRALTRIPFVESSFNVNAYSKVQASGIWQFIRSTGKVYLRIDDIVDERNDPWTAARAAARLLRQNFESLQSWPLAVMAYNHGRMGLVRAVRQIGSNDYHDVISEYRGKRFGFASRNFFMEFLASVEIERNAEKYFPGIARKPPAEFFEIKLPKPLRASALLNKMKFKKNDIQTLNPGLNPLIWSGKMAIPNDMLLRLPSTWSEPGQDPRVVFFERYYSTFGRNR